MGVVGLAFATAACTITIGSAPSRTPGLSPDPSPSQVPTGPGSAAAAMERLCESPKTGGGSGVTPEGPTPSAIATVEQQVETVRGLRYTSHVDVKALTQEQIDRRLTKNFDKTYPVDFYARRSQAWGTIGVIPAGASIRDALLAFQTGQVVGFYNPANKQLVYIGDAELSLTERFILAHELTHAIDDQHFGLSRLDSIAARCDDEVFTAGLGAIEGSAQFFATQVILRFPSDAPVGGGGDGGSLGDVPPFISDLQLWPYGAGMAFVQHLDDRGGTPLVDRALTTFPASTEQIIHPERWPYDTPQPVDVPDLGTALGAGWHDLDVMTVGEVWLQLMLELRLDAGDAGRAATGWDGGLYRAWTDGSRTAVVLRTVWDTPGDAQQFADAMGAWIGNGTAFVNDPVGARVDVGFASDDATLGALRSALS
ncbi:MAG: hypothetical protein ACXWEN_11330 [Actinomycetota bacterium]